MSQFSTKTFALMLSVCHVADCVNNFCSGTLLKFSQAKPSYFISFAQLSSQIQIFLDIYLKYHIGFF